MVWDSSWAESARPDHIRRAILERVTDPLATDDRERIDEVIRPIESRVGVPVAATCASVHVRTGEGQPTKRLRREVRARAQARGRLAVNPEGPAGTPRRE